MIRRLIRAVTPLFFDALGMIVFAVLLALHVNVTAATVASAVMACAIVGGSTAVAERSRRCSGSASYSFC
jgi:hypothetical protein